VESCEHFMGSDSFTGNFIFHLATHQITEESHNRKINDIQNKSQLSQLHNQLISLGNDEEFIEFVHELDPNYQFLSDKTILQLLAESYNQIKN
ncbi:2443_t:CDS:2, partial [Funneliformis caledonium]